jgi:hypothetical protein
VSGRIRRALLLIGASALVPLVWSAVAVGGSEPDPNTGDTVLGVAGGLRYSSDPAAFDLGNNGYGQTIAGCGPASESTLGGGAKLAGPPPGSRKIEGVRPYDWYDQDMLPNDGFSAGGYGSTTGTITAFAICETGSPDYYSLTVPSSSSSVRSATQECGASSGHVVGGGISIATSSSFISASRPIDGSSDADNHPDDGWSGRVFDSIGGAGGMYLDAVCQAGPVSYPTAQGKAATGHAVTLKAPCPGGSHVSDGGGKITGPGAQVYLAGSYPIDDADADAVPDDGWKTIAFNGSSSKQKLTAYAVCLG